MVSKYQKDFLKKYGLPDHAFLTIEEISAYTGIHTEHLYRVYNAGQVIEKQESKTFSFHKVVIKKPKGKGFECVYKYVMKPII